MKAKHSGWTIAVVLLLCGLPTYAQQASSASQRMRSLCSGQAGVPAWLMTRYCKPLSVVVQSQQLSNNLPRDNGDGGTLTTFQVPGAIVTYPQDINDAGTISGFWFDTNQAVHGFLRARDGRITTIDVPGAGTGPAEGTYAYGINQAGAITGYWCDQNFNCHGFVRDAHGTITSFDYPGAVYTGGQGINPSGTVTGFWADANGNGYGFVRSPRGEYASFDTPGFIDTSTSDIIDPRGDVTGGYFDTSSPHPAHGYFRRADGTLILFDGPGVCQTSNGTSVGGIDAAGVVAGGYLGSDCGTYHGYFRHPDGTFDISDFPGSEGTIFTAIAANGAVAGYAFTSSGIPAFLRTPGGAFYSFSLPSIVMGTNIAVNSAGTITGIYLATDQYVAYVWTQH